MASRPLPIKGASDKPKPGTVNLDKEEGAKEYCPGGYRPIAIGDELRRRRYTVVRKLGWGHFSTVWLVHDKREKIHVALKVVKSSPKYAQTARDEIALLNHITNSPNPTHPGRANLVQFMDSFELKPDDNIVSPGPTGDLRHVCMTFEPLGENLLSLLRRLQACDDTNLKTGIPTVLVQQITRQMLQGLDFLHKDCQLIHTDLKPENVMVVVEDVEELVRACAASEEMTGVSPSTANRIVPIPGSSKYEHGGGDWHNQKNVQIFGSYPLPSPMHEWGRENAGPEVSSLAVIMSQLAIQSKSQSNSDGDGEKVSTIPGSGASSFISVDSAASNFSISELSTAPTSLENSMVDTGKIRERVVLPISTSDESFPSSSRKEADDRVSAHSDTTVNVRDQEPDTGTTSRTNSAATILAPSPYTPTPTPSSTGPTPSLLTASAPPNHLHSRGRSINSVPSTPVTPASKPPPRIRIKIADMGNATPVHKHFTPDIQTRQYRCPEVILGYRDWDETVDIWSVGCMVFELLTSDFLFAPEPKEYRYSKDDDHMAQIIELLGDLPSHRKFGGKWSRDIFHRQGYLRNITRLRPWSLKMVLQQKYDYPPRQAKALKDFLVPMLALDPQERASAGEMAQHPWLDMEDAAPPFPSVQPTTEQASPEKHPNLETSTAFDTALHPEVAPRIQLPE